MSRRQPRRKVLGRRCVDLDHAHGHVRQRTALEIDQTARDRRIVGDELEAVAVGVVNRQLLGPGRSITFRKCGEEHAWVAVANKARGQLDPVDRESKPAVGAARRTNRRRNRRVR